MPAELQAGRWLRVSKSKNPVRERRVQVGDLLKVMSNPAEMVRQSPRAPKPRILIETMQVVGGEGSLTAQDHALYEIMLAWARKHGLDKDTHEIPAEAVKAYLGTARWDDVRRSTERLSSVMVRYDFRDEEWRRTGRIALVSVGLKESLKDGAAKFIEFEIPARIRAVMAEARDYAKLELGAFPKFTCKYTAALYQRLALRAGYDEVLIRPWEIEPAKLAADLGYPMRDGVLQYAEFRKRCLDPVLADLGYGVTRFVTTLEEVRGTRRGRPVEKLVWHVTPATKTVHEAPRAPLAVGELELVNSEDAVHPNSSMPKSGTVRRVLNHLKRALTVEELVEGWRAALDELAEGELAEGVPAPVPYVDVAGADLADQIARFGHDAAFSAWALGAAKTRRLLARLPSREEKAAKAEAARVMACAAHGEFDSATDIVVRLAPEADFAPVLDFLSALVTRNGTKLLTVEVERADGLRSQVIGWVRLDEEQREALHALPGLEAVRYVVIDREQPQEESREEKIARRRADMANDMLATLAKECHPRLVLDMLDSDMPPWTDCRPFLPNDGAQFKMALSLLEPELRRLLKEERIERVAVSPELRRVKATLVNFAKAARDGDFERLAKVSRAIHAVATQGARHPA